MGQLLINALSLTTPAVARPFYLACNSFRAHFFAGARTASVSVASLHLCHPNLLSPFPLHQLGVAHQPSLRSRSTMMSYSNSPSPREAGSLINRPVTVRTIARSRHPRTGITAFLLHLSTTTELVVINLIPQHDPHPDSEFASRRHSRLPQTFLDQFEAVEALQLRISAYRVHRRLAPEKPQQWIALLAQPAKLLPTSTGVFTRNDP